MRRALLTVGALLVTAPLAATPAFAAPGGRPTDHVVIDMVQVKGSGCRKQSTTVAMSLDNSAFTVSYSDFLVQVGPDAAKGDNKKDCQLRVKVKVPKKFTYAIEQVDYRGFAHLEKGATAKQVGTYAFQGQKEPPATANHSLSGPYDTNWQTTDVRSAAFEECGKQRALNINTELSLNLGTSDPNSTSYITMDSTDGSLHSVYRLAWRDCPIP
jgi:Domain of unknown function (DUF4360)